MNFKLQKINKKMTVVDIEVDESHTFTVGKSKMIVHNCYLPYIEDTKESLFKKSTESRILSTLGGGVGLGMGIRPRDEKSTGVMPHAKTYDADVNAYKQGESRRGAVAIYLDVTHPEIMEFITIRDPFGGDANRKSLNIHHGVNITDDFMERVETLSTKELSKAEIEEINKWVTYHPSGVTRVESVKDIFEKILETRLQTGEPYLHFIDTSNKHLPKPQRDLGMTVKQSNLCAEIIETTGTDYLGVNRTAICCLASVNISKYDEWKDNTQFIEDITEFLDNVIEKFIANASKIDGLEDVVHAAKMERSIGIGAMGFHDYLQQKMIAFESPMAVGINKKIFGFIHENAKKASMRLAQERGACPDYEEWLKRCLPSAEDIANNPPVRGMNLTAIAPNASSGIILNTSPSIEPYRANVYREEGDAGVHMRRNPNLEKLLEEKGMNSDQVWATIASDDGSVRSLKFLTDYEKDVFKTAIEIDQLWLIQHASDRQEFVDQSQSLNLFFSPTVAIEYVAYIHLLAWKMGLKTIYYGRSDALSKVGKLGKSLEREKIAQLQDLVVSDEEICLACQ